MESHEQEKLMAYLKYSTIFLAWVAYILGRNLQELLPFSNQRLEFKFEFKFN